MRLSFSVNYRQPKDDDIYTCGATVEFESDCTKQINIEETYTTDDKLTKIFEFDHTVTREAGSHSVGNPTCTTPATCEVCKKAYTVTDKHNYVLKYDGTKHWEECTENSNHKANEGEHSGGTAVCSTCNVSYGKVDSNNQSWDKTGYQDEGTYTATITGKGNFTGTVTKTFTINPADLTNVNVAQSGTLTYTGAARTPNVSASATTVDGAEVTFAYSRTQGDYGAMPGFTEGGTHTVYYKDGRCDR